MSPLHFRARSRGPHMTRAISWTSENVSTKVGIGDRVQTLYQRVISSLMLSACRKTWRTNLAAFQPYVHHATIAPRDQPGKSVKEHVRRHRYAIDFHKKVLVWPVLGLTPTRRTSRPSSGIVCLRQVKYGHQFPVVFVDWNSLSATIPGVILEYLGKKMRSTTLNLKSWWERY